mgnify:CR=1 FL=1
MKISLINKIVREESRISETIKTINRSHNLSILNLNKTKLLGKVLTKN